MTNSIVPKICSRCGGTGPFYTKKKPHNSWCVKCYKEKTLQYNRKSLYGITQEEYDQLLKQHRGRCAICKGTNNGKTLHVDHDHRTGKVRGLLCTNCNHGIGKFGDDPQLMCTAIRYLKS